jgi:hypothetical protein
MEKSLLPALDGYLSLKSREPGIMGKSMILFIYRILMGKKLKVPSGFASLRKAKKRTGG